MNLSKMNIDWDEMKVLETPLCCRNRRLLRVTEKKKLQMNRSLLLEIKEKNPSMELQVRYSEDFRIIGLKISNDNSTIKFNADGALKHPDFVNELSDKGYQIPAIYVVEWNEKEQAWVGILDEVPELGDPTVVIKKANQRRSAKQEKK